MVWLHSEGFKIFELPRELDGDAVYVESDTAQRIYEGHDVIRQCTYIFNAALAPGAVMELTSARKRIKAKFFVTPQSIELFFPPKWGIDDRLPESSVFGELG